MNNKLKQIRENNVWQSSEIQNIFQDARKLLLYPFCNVISDENLRFPLRVESKEGKYLNWWSSEHWLYGKFTTKKKIKNSKLLYRASRDGFLSSAFHKKCDNNGPTLVFIKSNEFYFGGFNSSHWEIKMIKNQQSNVSLFTPDNLFSNVNKNFYKDIVYMKSIKAPGSFLFSLNKRTKHEIHKNEDKAVLNYSVYGPVFGAGHDLKISSNCHENEESSSNLGNTYKSIGENPMNHLAGNSKFKLDDYEVFSIEFE